MYTIFKANTRTNITTNVIKRVINCLAVLGLLVGSFGTIPLPVHALGSLILSGAVSDQNGIGVANVSVSAMDTSDTTTLFGPTTTDSNGTYTLTVDPGTYDLHFSPPGGSGFNPIVENNLTVTGSQTINVQFTPHTNNMVSGTFLDATGAPAAVRIAIWDMNGDQVATGATDTAGNFRIPVPDGTYMFDLLSQGNNLPGANTAMPTGFWELIGGNQFKVAGNDINTGTFRMNVATVTLRVLDAQGNPLADTTVNSETSGTTALAPGQSFGVQGNFGDRSAVTNTDGTLVFQGFVGASYRLCINNWTVCTNITVQGNTSVNLSLPSKHAVSGTLLNGTGTPASNIAVDVIDGNTDTNMGQGSTDATGAFQVPVPDGSYRISFGGRTNSGDSSLPAGGWSMESNTWFTVAGSDVNTGIFRMKLATMTVHVTDSSGNLISNESVSTDAEGPMIMDSGQSLWVRESFSDSNGAPGTDGLVRFVGADGPTYTLCVRSGTICSKVTMHGDTTATIVIPTNHTISAKFLDNSGTVANIRAALMEQSSGNLLTQNTVDASGTVYFPVPNGTYSFDLSSTSYNQPVDGNPNMPTGFWELVSNDGITVAGSDVDAGILQMKLAHGIVYVKDAQGNPVARSMTGEAWGETVFATGQRMTVRGNLGRDYISTDAQGMFSFTGFDGATYQLCTLNNICTSITLHGDTTAILQEAPVRPSPPTNLHASSPTQLPVALAWDTTGGASFYNIYRNNSKIGTSTSPSFSDTTAQNGTNSYYVTAVNVSGESDPSGNISVVVAQNQAPNITPLQGSTIGINGSYAENGTFTDPDSTSWVASVNYGDGSGTQTLPLAGYGFALGHIYSAPGTYTVTVYITDNQGATGTTSATVLVKDLTAPVVNGTTDRTPDNGTWYNHDVTITWAPSDPDSGATIPPSTTASTEGKDITYTSAPSCDPSNNCASGTYTLSLDKTPPILGAATWSSDTVHVGDSVTLAVPVTDGVGSGAVSGEYFVDSDKGIGTSTHVDLTNGNLSITFGPSTITAAAGVYTIGFRVKDAAGNWSITATRLLTVSPTTINTQLGVTGSLKKKSDFVPNSTSKLPGIDGVTPADYGFTVQYKQGVLDPKNDFTFTYAANGHSLNLAATSITSLLIGGTNNSQAWFQGVGLLTIDGGTPTTNTFLVTAVDGGRISSRTPNHVDIRIYAQGADPNTSAPLYTAIGDVSSPNSVKIN